ncbi:amidophosphoribosyltransferase [Pseudomonas sp. G11-1]|nr:amidophosphoribosyltransferase [Pseudomonas sp. G11-1]MCO5790531.1 amidophosphoribosyltransferase [Pseudomonas sp. G11-2]
MISKVYNWTHFDQFNRCLLCLGSAAGISECLCNGCLADLPWLGPACRQCALPLPLAGQLCGQCQQRPPAFTQVITPFCYRFPLDSLIPAFKYNHQLTYGRLLARLLHQAVVHHYQEHSLALPDMLIPMPLHRARQAQRGYNQALELARPIARLLKLPLDRKTLVRQRSTAPQQGLDAQARRQNLQNAFACRHPERLAGKHIALIDDVVTTGTTINEASRTLLAAGAASVSIWCVARTP